MRNFIIRFFTLPSLRWLVARAVTQMTDEEVERLHWKQLVWEAAQLVGLGGATFVLLVNFVFTTGLDNKLDPIVPDSTEILVVARAPNDVDFALSFCNDSATVYEPPVFVPPEDFGRIILKRGSESINWPGRSGPNGNLAEYKFTTVDNKDAEPQTVVLDDKAKDCFMKKAGKK